MGLVIWANFFVELSSSREQGAKPSSLASFELASNSDFPKENLPVGASSEMKASFRFSRKLHGSSQLTSPRDDQRISSQLTSPPGDQEASTKLTSSQ